MMVLNLMLILSIKRLFSCFLFLIFLCASAGHTAETVEEKAAETSMEFESDLIWTAKEIRILRSLSLASLGSVPMSPSNAYANSKKAAKLGRWIFYDKAFSGNGKLSCASCHQPDKYFTDGLPKAHGVNLTGRNTPTIVGSAYSDWFYWDGRRDSLWSQALVPFEAIDEMGGSRLAVVQRVANSRKYRRIYELVFGDIPPMLFDPSLPKNAGPLGNVQVQHNWNSLPKNTQKMINKVFSNIGKSIEAYERTLLPQITQFDRYVEALMNQKQKNVSSLLSDSAIAGVKLFINDEKTQCLRCHNGPMFTNGGFHNTGTGGFSGEYMDFGRVYGLASLTDSEFNCLGPYSDADPDECLGLRFLNQSGDSGMVGAFKTPSLRNVENTAPYFHDGRFNDIFQMINYYNNPPLMAGAEGKHELVAMKLSDEEIVQLISFLQSLSND